MASVPPERHLLRARDYVDAHYAEAIGVEVDANPEELRGLAVDDDAGVDRLAAVDARHDTQHRVLERVARHDDPPKSIPRSRNFGSTRSRPPSATVRRRAASQSARMSSRSSSAST